MRQRHLNLWRIRFGTAVLMAAGLSACGSTQPTQPSSTNQVSPHVALAIAPKKSNVLIIGGESLPYSSIVKNFSNFDAKDRKKNLSIILSLLNPDFNRDFENEKFFTVVNKIDPKTEGVAFGDFFGLDTSLTSLTKKNGKLDFEPLNPSPVNYNLIVGNQSFAMSVEKASNRTVPSANFSMNNIQDPSLIELQIDGKNIIQTNLPRFKISSENLAKLVNLKLNLSKDNYAEPIPFQSTETNGEQSTSCFIVSAWEDNGQNSAVLFTNFMDFENNQINFSNFKKDADKLKKISGMTFDDKTATQLTCASMDLSSDQPFHTIAISQIPVHVEIIDQPENPDSSAGQPAENIKPAEKTTAPVTNIVNPNVPATTPINPLNDSKSIVASETKEEITTPTSETKNTQPGGIKKSTSVEAPKTVTVNTKTVTTKKPLENKTNVISQQALKLKTAADQQKKQRDQQEKDQQKKLTSDQKRTDPNYDPENKTDLNTVFNEFNQYRQQHQNSTTSTKTINTK